MRHSDPKLTDKTYTDDTLLPLQTEVARIEENPDLIRQLIRQTGENGQKPENLDESCDPMWFRSKPLIGKDGAAFSMVYGLIINGGGGGSRTRKASRARY